ncbi:MAG TPA: HXXEE domain-containing protein [Phototrophicaceae bacterium]|nr:HXXEE domain-containing protein [Phototrophicaceae bacterium]
MPVLDQLSFTHLLWFVPLLFALHNVEEAFGMERWSRAIHSPRPVTTPQFTVAVTLLTAIAFLLTGVAVTQPPNSWSVYAVIAIQVVNLVNTFVPHLAATLRFRRYSPGVITGSLLYLPFSLYLLQRAFQEHYLDTSGLLILLALSPVIMVVAIFTSLSLGNILARHLRLS